MANIVKLTNCTVIEDSRYTPEKTAAEGRKVDARLWLRVKEAETEGGWFNVWPLVIWGALATKLKDVLKKDATVAHIIATCKVVSEKDDSGHWSQYLELRPVRTKEGAYRDDAFGTITQAAPVAAPAPAANPDLSGVLAALGANPQMLAALMALVGQAAVPQAAPAAQAPKAQAASTAASEMDASYFEDPGDEGNPFGE